MNHRIFYHGTTAEQLRSIKSNGLRKGTFVSPDRKTAEHFSRTRSEWNGQVPVVLVLDNPKTSPVTTDKSGRRECKLLGRFPLLIACLLLLTASVYGQTTQPARSVRFATSDPATCQPTGNNILLRTDTGELKVCSATDTWSVVGGGSAVAPSNATYITQTPNATLTNEQALSALSTGIMRVATTTGVITSLTNSAGIAANISDETGTDALVFATSPTLVTPAIGAATGTSLNLSAGLTVGNGLVLSAGQLTVPAGTSSLPPIARAADTSQGIFMDGTGTKIVQGGNTLVTFANSGGITFHFSGPQIPQSSLVTFGGDTAIGRDIASFLTPSDGSSGAGGFTLNERSANPANPTQDTQVHFYVKADKLVFQFNNGGTVRYVTYDLTQSATSLWATSTSAP